MSETMERRLSFCEKMGGLCEHIKMMCRYFIAYSLIVYGASAVLLLVMMQYYASAAVALIVPIIGYKIIFGVGYVHQRHLEF